MPTVRISLATLLAIVAVLALGLAGVASASRLSTMVAATVTLAWLLTAILAAWLRRGIDRAFWVGFALFGWVYLVLVNWDWVGGQFGHDLTGALNGFAEALVPEVPVPAAPQFRTPQSMMRFGLLTDSQRAMMQLRETKVGNLVQIGRMLLALLFALVGGGIARRLAARRGDHP
jgi:hypothetical protein